MKMPKALGACVDLAYKLEQERLAFQRTVEAKIAKMKAKEQEVEDYLLATFGEEKLGKSGGRLAVASVTKTPLPQVEDWDAFYAHIKETGAFDLLEKRPARGAYKERIEAGDRVPGVKTFWKKSLSLRAITKK